MSLLIDHFEQHNPVVANSLQRNLQVAFSRVPIIRQRLDSKLNEEMTNDDIAVIHLYTMASEPIESSFYWILNQSLRIADSNSKCQIAPILWLFLNALDKLPEYSGSVLFRGVRGKDASESYKTALVTWPAFISCTCTIEALVRPYFLGLNGDRTVFNIELCNHAVPLSRRSKLSESGTYRRAKSIALFAETPEENEVLLMPDSSFSVKSLLGPTDDGMVIVQLAEIPAKHPLY